MFVTPTQLGPNINGNHVWGVKSIYLTHGTCGACACVFMLHRYILEHLNRASGVYSYTFNEMVIRATTGMCVCVC